MKKLIFIAALFMVACESVSLDPNDVTVTTAEIPAADEVKLIHRSITSPMEEGTFKSAEYDISPDSRLLIRLGKLKNVVGELLDQQPVLVRIAPLDGHVALGRQNLRLCPMTTNWMMYATWKKAHTFKGGSWKGDGADFVQSDCIDALPTNSPVFAQAEEAAFCDIGRVLCFDVKNHVRNYVRSRNVNYGWILINENSQVVAIHGDESSVAPAVFYRRFRSY